MGADGLTAHAWRRLDPSMRLGTAILPAYTRTGLLAQSVAGLASAAPGRFVLGIGSSSNVIAERWNGIPFEKPFQQTRDMVRFLKAALGGEKVTKTFDTFDIKGFRLGLVPEQPVPILVAALREGMLRMAGRESDGAIINWLSADNAATASNIVREKIRCRDRRPSVRRPDAGYRVGSIDGQSRAAAYLNVPVYRAFHERTGQRRRSG